MIYSDDLPLNSALELYFARSGFSADTYTEDWIKLPVGKFHFYAPNFSARKKAVPLHDVDHVLTEYETDWKGEWQISAFEIGTGCGNYWAAWMINSQGIIAGALCYPKLSVAAFARGRRSQGIYKNQSYDQLLTEKVGDLRQKFTAARESVTPSFKDGILFYTVVLLSAVLNFAPLVALGFLVKDLLRH